MAGIRVRVLQLWLELIPVCTPQMMTSIWKTGRMLAAILAGRAVVVVEMPMRDDNVSNLVGLHVRLGQPSQQARWWLIVRNCPRVVVREVKGAGVNED